MNKLKINYVVGDVCQPQGDGKKLIVHCCNNIGAFGAGVALAIAKNFPMAKVSYKHWFMVSQSLGEKLPLGEVQFIQINDNITIANLIGQDGVGFQGNRPPIRYDAINDGMIKIFEYAQKNNFEIHMPFLGCGLAGGSWGNIEGILQETWEYFHQNKSMGKLDVFVYKLPHEANQLLKEFDSYSLDLLYEISLNPNDELDESDYDTFDWLAEFNLIGFDEYSQDSDCWITNLGKYILQLHHKENEQFSR